MSSDAPDDASDPGQQLVQFDYIKSNYFRTVRSDGAIGGLTPSGSLHFALYTERAAIPRITRHRVDHSGKRLSEPVEVEARDGYVRELEVDVFMSLDAAKNLADWIQERLAEAEARVSKGTIQ